jgi:hypothetical protein
MISNVWVTAGHAAELKLSLAIAMQQQQVTVDDEKQGLTIEPDKNSGAMVLKGGDLEARRIYQRRQQLGSVPGPRGYLRAAGLFDCDGGKGDAPLRHAPARLQGCELFHIGKQRDPFIQYHCGLPGIDAGAVFRNGDKQMETPFRQVIE